MKKSWIILFALLGGCDNNPSDTAAPEALVEGLGCDEATVYERPADPAARGPWAVGARTVTLGRLNVEVLYPATVGSEEGAAPLDVDIRYALPESEQAKVTEGERPYQSCDCYPDLPVDEAHGPYPLILFVHGTASWRTQSLSLMEHWASRGFVVAAADHPGLWLSDTLASVCGLPATGSMDLLGDVETVLAGFTEHDPALSFVSHRTNVDKVAVVGHSAGASAASAADDLAGASVVISMAGSGAVNGTDVESALFLGGMSDSVVSFSQTQSAYEQSLAPKQLVGIAEAGHLVFSDICELTNDNGQDLIEIATDAGVCGTQFASFLFDCAASTIPAADARAIIKSASTWQLETHLHCNADQKAFGDFGELQTWIDVLEVD